MELKERKTDYVLSTEADILGSQRENYVNQTIM